MGEMDQPTLVVPDVLAVDDHVVSRSDRHSLSDGHVVVHEDRLCRAGKANDETLVGTGRTAVIRENTGHRTFGGDLDGRAMLGEVTLDGRVVRGRGCARRTQEQKQCYADASHTPTVAAQENRARTRKDPSA